MTETQSPTDPLREALRYIREMLPQELWDTPDRYTGERPSFQTLDADQVFAVIDAALSTKPDRPETGEPVAEAITKASGLSRTRLAELLYEHEGFVDFAHGNHVPDRDVPVWIEGEIARNIHSGDCTKECHACMRCHADMALEQWDAFVGMIERAALSRQPEGEG